MKIYTLKRTEFLAVPIGTAWDFFSNPDNLPEITPPGLNLRIRSEAEEKIYPGMIITCTVTPIPFLKSRWTTEITHVGPPHYFVDEQRFGPCRFWHHKHFFAQVGEQAQVRDLIHYSLPSDPIGRLANSLLASRKLDSIFNYRSRCPGKLLGNQKKSSKLSPTSGS